MCHAGRRLVRKFEKEALKSKELIKLVKIKSGQKYIFSSIQSLAILEQFSIKNRILHAKPDKNNEKCFKNAG